MGTRPPWPESFYFTEVGYVTRELVLDGIHATTSRGFLKKQHTYLTATDFRFPSVQRILPGCPTGVLGEPPSRSSTM
jgi:hypothetical protein